MESVQACTLRGQFELVKQENPINLSEVSTLRLQYVLYLLHLIYPIAHDWFPPTFSLLSMKPDSVCEMEE